MPEKVLEKLRELTRHKYVKLTNCGNSAIFTALYIAKKKNPKPFVLIPDQGGWSTYRSYPKIMNFEVKEIKTKSGLVDLDDLKEKAKTGAAFIVSSFGGYIVEQDMKSISEICKKNECILIEDVSGSLGDETLCNGEHADIMIGSFGKWKAADLGHGGFISGKDDDYFKDNVALSLAKHHTELKPLLEKLEKTNSRIKYLLAVSDKIKNDFENFDVVHREKRGINVAIRFTCEAEKKAIINYCNENNYEYTTCPRYIRVDEEAISIEVKRLNGDGNE